MPKKDDLERLLVTDDASKFLDFEEKLDTLCDEIIARVEEVGLEQAAEEYWVLAQQKLNATCERLREYRERHGIPEDEL